MPKPLKFTLDMLHAIRNNRKTQTRRPVNKALQVYDTVWDTSTSDPGVEFDFHFKAGDGVALACPYGKPGTRHTLDHVTVIEITDIRVERVRVISEADCVAEGIMPQYCCGDCAYPKKTAKRPFSELWDSIYDDRGLGWDANPWVWVITFKRITP